MKLLTMLGSLLKEIEGFEGFQTLKAAARASTY
jgi:hypothetical protein